MKKRTQTTLVWVAIACLLLLPASATANEWQWGATIYGWFSDIGVDASLNDHEIIEGEIDVKDIMDGVDFIAQVNIQGQRGKWGMLLDVNYIDLGADQVRIDLPGIHGSELVLKGDLEQTLIDAAALYNPRGDGLGFTFMGGARILDLDQEIRAHIDTPAGPSDHRRYTASGTLLDFMIGVRWAEQFADRWLVNLKADTSFGETEFTLDGLIAIGYSFGKDGRYTLLGGYRYLELEMQDETPDYKLEKRLYMSGGFLGIRFGF